MHKKPKAPIFIGALGFIEGCMFAVLSAADCGMSCGFKERRKYFLVVFFGSRLNNCIGKSLAVFNEEDAENAEDEHDGAVNEE